MTNLLLRMQKEKKTDSFIWTDKADEAFYMLKEYFLSTLLLQYFNLKKSSQVKTNASDKEVAEILLQPNNESTGTEQFVWKPVTFYLRKLTSAERNYITENQKMLTIVKCFKEVVILS